MTRIALLLFLAAATPDPAALITEGRYEEARAALEIELEAVSAEADRAPILDRIGVTWLYEGRWWRAETYFARSLEAKETGEAHRHRGQAYFGAGRAAMRDGTALGAEIRSLMNDAARELRRAVELEPGDVAACVALGLAERYRLDTPAEIAALTKALELEPGHPVAAIHLAWRLARQGDVKGAREVLLTVPEARRTAEHFKALGRLAARAGEDEAAGGYYTRAGLLDPDDREIYDGLWKVTAFRKRFGAFNAAMVEILGKHETAWWAHYYLGFSLLDDGKPKEAVAEFERAASINPEFTSARVMVAQVLLTRLKETAKGIEVYREVLEKEPANERARTAIIEVAMLRARDGRHAEAGTLFEVLVRADPGNPYHRMNLALTLKEQGRFDEALAIYEKAEEEFPFEPQVPNDRGLLLMGKGRHEDAFDAFREALSRDDEFLDTLENLGAYALLRGDEGAAITWFTKAHDRVIREGGDPSKFRRYLDLARGEQEEGR